jgi:hypothetical protein
MSDDISFHVQEMNKRGKWETMEAYGITFIFKSRDIADSIAKGLVDRGAAGPFRICPSYLSESQSNPIHPDIPPSPLDIFAKEILMG